MRSMIVRHGRLRTRRLGLGALALVLALFSSPLTAPALQAQTDVSQTPTGDTSGAVVNAPTATPTPLVAPTAAPGDRDDQDSTGFEEHFSDGGPHNVVRIVNRTDFRLRVKGRVQLNHIPGPNADPLNEAVAYSATCTGCETLAVALQIDLISKTATNIAPQNYAIAVNYRCTSCHTIAKALQYVLQVDDPAAPVPDDVSDLVHQMNERLNELHEGQDGLTLDQAEAQVDAVIAQFQQLAANLITQRDEQDNREGAPTPTASPPTTTPAASATAVATVTPAPSATPTAAISATATSPTAASTPTP